MRHNRYRISKTKETRVAPGDPTVDRVRKSEPPSAKITTRLCKSIRSRSKQTGWCSSRLRVVLAAPWCLIVVRIVEKWFITVRTRTQYIKRPPSTTSIPTSRSIYELSHSLPRMKSRSRIRRVMIRKEVAIKTCESINLAVPTKWTPTLTLFRRTVAVARRDPTFHFRSLAEITITAPSAPHQKHWINLFKIVSRTSQRYCSDPVPIRRDTSLASRPRSRISGERRALIATSALDSSQYRRRRMPSPLSTRYLQVRWSSKARSLNRKKRRWRDHKRIRKKRWKRLLRLHRSI